MNFTGFPKIARLSRTCSITEKIDGTNAYIYIPEDDSPVLFGSRKRWITPEDDNYGFAKWATDNLEGLKELGPGHHFGEWWGAGIQRRYNMDRKVFSLFNVFRWKDGHPECCSTVPLLYSGIFDTFEIDTVLLKLKAQGSAASPGFMNPEGIVIWHDAARVLFKKTLGGDGHKG